MKVFLLLAAMILTFGPIQIQGIFKKFSEVVEYETKRSATLFSNYGCHCGAGGGGDPMDDTDRCCFDHKCCYEGLRSYGCHNTSLHYQTTFRWNNIICEEFQDVCAKKLCVCDILATRCFAGSMNTYNPKNQGYPKKLCKGKSPWCCVNCLSWLQ